MQIHVALRQRGWSGLVYDLSHALFLSSYTFLTRQACAGGAILMISTSYAVFLRKRFPLAVAIRLLPFKGPNPLKTQIFKPS